MKGDKFTYLLWKMWIIYSFIYSFTYSANFIENLLHVTHCQMYSEYSSEQRSPCSQKSLNSKKERLKCKWFGSFCDCSVKTIKWVSCGITGTGGWWRKGKDTLYKVFRERLSGECLSWDMIGKRFPKESHVTT